MAGLRTRQRLGKYRIVKRLADGGFASVYHAQDTIEGLPVALKVPHPDLVDKEMLADFRNEVRLTARLEHPHILPLKNADYIDGRLVVAFPLGEKTLADRLRSRMSMRAALLLAEQMLEGVAYAHGKGIIHCDIKPENLILFPENHLCLSDFGIAKVAQKTILASGSGTVGYVAPEQAMGRPSFHSDVFSLGLVMYRMFSGRLPEWPFYWPPPGYERLTRLVHPQLIRLLEKAIEIDPRYRFSDAEQMLASFARVKARAHRFRASGNGTVRNGTKRRDWREVRRQQFQRQYGKILETRHECSRCKGPVSEAMQSCPWCGRKRKTHQGDTLFPAQCHRCGRGVKLDWPYCAWCYGAGFDLSTTREYTDQRYQARCSHASCSRRLLMPYMRYCPWCRRRIRRKWKIPGTRETCTGCGWGVLKAYWSYCAWCGKAQPNK
ncbi:MAG: serine/threonine protein kinase [Pirellulaceae bacterium]|nr:serine/threonine protein kinase [Pirellulaceae bacterium]